MDNFQEERTKGNTNFKNFLCKVVDGNFTATMKVLCYSGMAPYNSDTIKDLEATHPYNPPPSMLSTIYYKPLIVVEIDNVLGCIKLYPKGTSYGRYSLRTQYILYALCSHKSLMFHHRNS